MIWTQLRLLATLKRIAKALEARNELTRQRMLSDYPEYARAQGKAKVASKMVDFGVATPADFNARWKAEHGAED